MNTSVRVAFVWTIIGLNASVAHAQWVTFSNETDLRMPTGPGLNDPVTSTADVVEKTYSAGDVDRDGDVDLISVRKLPFTVAGPRPNVLFMNEGIAEGHSVDGVLVDRTAQYVTASDAPEWQGQPDMGFLTPTNDRDAVLVDLNNDKWLDIVTSTTVSNNTPKHIGHPRIYINLGEVDGVWQGFKHEEARIPFLGFPDLPLVNPRFCGVAVDDVNNDGYPDLHFADYDSSGTGPAENPLHDYNNKLLINAGEANPGYFADSGTTRMSAAVGLNSNFGMRGFIGDMNGDGANDVVKHTTIGMPQHIAIQHNDPNNVGFFPDSAYKIVYNNAPYNVNVADLNNDGKLDLFVGDDNTDRYLLNTGNAANGTATFSSHTVSFQAGGDDGFVGDIEIADLNNDGWKDVLIADVEIDGFGCARRTHIYRNLANAPNVTLQEQSPPVIPNAMLTGTHHIAVIDIDGDGWQDLVIGRCTGTQVWRNTTPIPGDADGDHAINVDDLLIVINSWGTCPGAPDVCPADLNDDGMVDVNDLLQVINNWDG